MSQVVGKTTTVALIEQVGALVATIVSAVLMQHVYATTLLHEPQSSWITRGVNWWADRRLRKEREWHIKLNRTYGQPGVPGPEP